MADLTERQPLTQGTNRIIEDPVPYSGVDDVLGFLGSTLSTFAKVKETSAANKAAAAKEAAKVEKDSAELDAVRAPQQAQDDVIARAGNIRGANAQLDQLGTNMLDAYGNKPLSVDMSRVDEATGKTFSDAPATIDPVVKKDVTSAGQELQSISAAVEQGRMPPISLQAAITGRFNALITKHPTEAKNIYGILKEMGVSGLLNRGLTDEVGDLEAAQTREHSQAEDARKFRQSAREAGVHNLGAAAAHMTDDEIVNSGLESWRIDNELGRLDKQTQINKMNADMSAADRKEAAENTSLETVRIITGNVAARAAPFVRMAQEAADAMGTDLTGTSSEHWTNIGVLAKSKVDEVISGSVNLAVQRGYTGDQNALRNSIAAQYEPMLDLFSDNFGVMKANQEALKSIQTKGALNMERALPVFNALKKAGLPVAEMPGMMAGVAQNPDLQKALQEEMKGFSTDFGQERASTHLMNIVKILRGEATLSQMSGADSRKLLPTLYGASKEFAASYVAGKSGSESFLHSIGEVTLATRSLSPSSGSAAHNMAAIGIGLPSHRNALLKTMNDPGADHVMAAATIQAVRAGGAVILNDVRTNLPKINKEERYFELKWDNQNGKYYIDDSKKKAAIEAAKHATPIGGASAPMGLAIRGSVGPSVAQVQAAKSSEGMNQWLASANISLDNIVELGKADPSTPKGSALELRRYYGDNQRLKSQQDDEASPSTGQNREKILTKLEDSLKGMHVDPVDVAPARGVDGAAAGPGARSVTGVKGQTVSVPAVEQIATKFASNPNLALVRKVAQAKGVDPDLATRLAYVENKFNHGNTNSAGASGIMQVRGFNPKTGAAVHDTEALKRFGKRVKDLSPEENVELGMDILKRGFDKSGNWNKALQAYLGHGNDGNLTSAQYASLIE